MPRALGEGYLRVEHIVLEEQGTAVWYNFWEYDLVDWLPCPGCFDLHEYTLDLCLFTDPHGVLDGSLDLDHDFSDPYYGDGVIVECEYDETGNIVGRIFRGCAICGGGGECYKGSDDTVIGKSWHQWVIVEGGIVEGTGRVSK